LEVTSVAGTMFVGSGMVSIGIKAAEFLRALG